MMGLNCALASKTADLHVEVLLISTLLRRLILKANVLAKNFLSWKR